MKKKYDLKRISSLPSQEEISEFQKLIFNKSTKEKPDVQNFIDNHPEILFPLELSVFVCELRYPKRNIKNPSAPSNNSPGRITDFDGVTLEGLAYPVIIEAKGPNTDILNSDGTLSDISSRVIKQVRTGIVHMLRPTGRELRAELFKKPVDEVLDEELIEEFEALDNSTAVDSHNNTIISIMQKLIEHGCGLIALIGLSNEFKDNPQLLETAREMYLDEGVLLLTYDELLVMNKVVVDFFSSDQSLFTFFDSTSWENSPSGSYIRQNSTLLFTAELKQELQRKIYAISQDVCLFGIGPPHPPSRIEDEDGEIKRATLEKADYFHVGMLWAKPTHLGGYERLLWAGKHQEKWIAVKERLTDPLKGGVVWYFFLPPFENEPILK